MVGFILTGHGEFAPGVASSLSSLVGPIPRFAQVAYRLGEESNYVGDLTRAIGTTGQDKQGVIVFCDVVGGTPFNQAIALVQHMDRVEIITGANVGMLLQATNLRTEETPLEKLVAAALKAGKDSIKHPGDTELVTSEL